MYSAAECSCHAIPGLAAGKNRVQIVQGPETHGIPGLPGGAADMRQQEGVIEFAVARVNIRLVVVDVETGRRHPARAKRRLQRLVVDQGSAGGVDQNHPGAQPTRCARR